MRSNELRTKDWRTGEQISISIATCPQSFVDEEVERIDECNIPEHICAVRPPDALRTGRAERSCRELRRFCGRWCAGCDLPVLLASVLATEAAILSNFLLNDRWTFRTAAHRAHVSATAAALQWRGARRHGDHRRSTGRADRLRTSASAVRQSARRWRRDGWNYVVNSRWTWGSRRRRRQATGRRYSRFIDRLPSSSTVGRARR